LAVRSVGLDELRLPSISPIVSQHLSIPLLRSDLFCRPNSFLPAQFFLEADLLWHSPSCPRSPGSRTSQRQSKSTPHERLESWSITEEASRSRQVLRARAEYDGGGTMLLLRRRWFRTSKLLLSSLRVREVRLTKRPLPTGSSISGSRNSTPQPTRPRGRLVLVAEIWCRETRSDPDEGGTEPDNRQLDAQSQLVGRTRGQASSRGMATYSSRYARKTGTSTTGRSPRLWRSDSRLDQSLHRFHPHFIRSRLSRFSSSSSLRRLLLQPPNSLSFPSLAIDRISLTLNPFSGSIR
jgi:hypothetical protein